MTTDFLHGVEVVELDRGSRPITFRRSSVIGLVGTAPNSESAAAASLLIGDEGDNNAISFTAATAGVEGNGISLYFNSLGASQTLAVSVSQARITVTLATDGDGVITSTADDVVTALGNDTAASALVTAANAGASTGVGLFPVTPVLQYLTGGEDEAFPTDTPTLLTGSSYEAERLGTDGTLLKAVQAIWDHDRAWIVVVRVAEGVDDDATKTNVIGSSTARSGIYALLDSEPNTSVQPKIIIAPEWSDDVSVASALDNVADDLWAIAVVEGPSTTDQAAITYRANFGSQRIYMVDPKVKVWDAETNAYEYRGASSYVAGVIAENDGDRGWHTSPSNRPMRSIVGTERGIDFDLSNSNARSNLLNEANVNTIVQQTGWRLWGNHTTAADPKWRFISVRRTADMLYQALIASHLWAVDRNITKTYVDDVIFGVKQFIAQQIKLDHIAGGDIWADEELNTPESLEAGRIYFNLDFQPYPPAERITFRASLNNQYLRNIFADAA